MSHTPGPWIVETPTDESWRESYPRKVAVRSHWNPPVDNRVGYEVCKMSGVHDHTMGNARLIAAAPEMLDLLRQARRRWLDAARAQEYWTPQEKDDLRRIDSTIAKATGGAE